MIDSRKVEDLHPTLARGYYELVRRMEAKGYPVLLTNTYRDKEYQNYLYNQGRTRPGPIVTNAKGGESIHNYRLAFDIAQNIKGKEYSDKNFFDTAGKIWQEMGGEWGGAWKSFVDLPHFQYTGGLSLKDLQNGKALPMNAKMSWESNKPMEDISYKPKNLWEVRDNMINISVINVDGATHSIDRITITNEKFKKIKKIAGLLGYSLSYNPSSEMLTLNSLQ